MTRETARHGTTADRCPAEWTDPAGTIHRCQRTQGHVKPHRCGCWSERPLDAATEDPMP